MASFTITPTMIAIAKMDNATNRRIALRRLVTPHLSEMVDRLPAGHLANTLNASPLVGDGPDRIKVRPTSAGLRDVLDEDTLWALALDRTYDNDRGLRIDCHMLGNTIHAISHPEDNGVRATGTKTGWAFGRSKFVQLATDESGSPDGTMQRAVLNFAHRLSAGDEAFLRGNSVGLLPSHIDCPDLGALDPTRSGEDASASDLIPTATETTPMTKRSLVTFTVPSDPKQKMLLDLALGNAGLGDSDALMAEFVVLSKSADEAERLQDEVNRLKVSLSKASVAAAPKEVAASGVIPSGKVVMRKAIEVFGLPPKAEAFDFEVPVWEWDGDHPNVPAADPNYIFQGMPLLMVLRAIILDERVYLKGHTGTGKTTLVQQVAARLNWPCMRINFDSEIQRGDLIGRDTISTDGKGGSYSKFVDGVLPTMLAGPNLAIFDEIDFVRPDVAYVMQSVLEGNGMVIAEDGGRIVPRHAWCRIFGTGNTAGQGDETGLYQGARPQSSALLDRFTTWIDVDYLAQDQRLALIKMSVPDLDEATAEQVSKYVTEHIEGFKSAKIFQPMSPRGMIALAKKIADYKSVFPSGAANQKRAVKEAVMATVINRATEQDRVVLLRIAQGVFGFSI